MALRSASYTADNSIPHPRHRPGRQCAVTAGDVRSTSRPECALHSSSHGPSSHGRRHAEISCPRLRAEEGEPCQLAPGTRLSATPPGTWRAVRSKKERRPDSSSSSCAKRPRCSLTVCSDLHNAMSPGRLPSDSDQASACDQLRIKPRPALNQKRQPFTRQARYDAYALRHPLRRGTRLRGITPRGARHSFLRRAETRAGHPPGRRSEPRCTFRRPRARRSRLRRVASRAIAVASPEAVVRRSACRRKRSLQQRAGARRHLRRTDSIRRPATTRSITAALRSRGYRRRSRVNRSAVVQVSRQGASHV